MGTDPITHEQTVAEIDDLKARLAAVTKERDEANEKMNAKYWDAVRDENGKLRTRNAALVEVVEGLVSAFATVRERNTPNWMDYITETINKRLAQIGHTDRVRRQWDTLVFVRPAALAAADAALKDTQPCGHPRWAIVSADEGTAYCSECERNTKGTPDGE